MNTLRSFARLPLICYGRVAPLLDSKTKIVNSKLVKEHVEKSIALDPTDDYAYHVLGAWHYELGSLNPVLRAVAQVIYGTIPTASYRTRPDLRGTRTKTSRPQVDQ